MLKEFVKIFWRQAVVFHSIAGCVTHLNGLNFIEPFYSPLHSGITNTKIAIIVSLEAYLSNNR